MLALCCVMLAYVDPMLRPRDPPGPYMFAHVDPTWAYVGPRSQLGWPMLALCCAIILSCPYLGPTLGAIMTYVSLSWPYVGPSPPHSSDRKGGGGEGVGRTRSAAGAARLYNPGDGHSPVSLPEAFGSNRRL